MDKNKYNPYAIKKDINKPFNFIEEPYNPYVIAKETRINYMVPFKTKPKQKQKK